MQHTQSAHTNAPAPQKFAQTIVGSVAQLEMIPVDADPTHTIWMSATEVPWDLYDDFVFRLDEQEETSAGNPGADAVTRPSKPYIAMDRGFGRHGYPAISMSFKGAQNFCAWLSAKTGKHYRLPTTTEWRLACGDPAHLNFDKVAWHAGNSERKTHPVGTLAATGRGFFDMFGNAAEWCVDETGKGVVVGGSYRDRATDWNFGPLIIQQSPAWNASDPQIPKSQWWLADGGFIGFRVVCDSPELIPMAPAPKPAN